MPFKKFGLVYNPVQFRFMVFINDQFELFLRQRPLGQPKELSLD